MNQNQQNRDSSASSVNSDEDLSGNDYENQRMQALLSKRESKNQKTKLKYVTTRLQKRPGKYEYKNTTVKPSKPKQIQKTFGDARIQKT